MISRLTRFRSLLSHQAVLLGGIILIGLALRLWGIGFGLPYEYHVDEVQYVRQAASMGSRGLEPTWWNNPPFFKYLLLAEDVGLFLAGKVAGIYTSAADFGTRNSSDPTLLYLLGRTTSALFGTLTVLVSYWLGKVAYNRRVGLLAAWFVAVAFMLVRDSHYATNDIALTFFVALGVLCAVRISRTGQTRWYVLGGVALGLGFATKYTGAVIAVPLFISHIYSPLPAK